MKAQEILLPGKIAVELGTGVYNDTCIIYDGTKVWRFTLKNAKSKSYDGLTWLNTQDAFLVTETIQNDSETKNLESNIVKIDLNGNIVERILDTKYPQSVGLTHLSGRDRWLLYFSSIEKENANVMDAFNPLESLVIMDFNTRQILKTFPPVGGLHLQVEESPWLQDENRFVYSITNARQVEVEGEPPMEVAEKPGIYLYDLSKDTSTLLVPGGVHGIASPVRNEVAFMKDNRVGIINLQDMTTRWLYDFTKSSVMHWTPDGNYIYLTEAKRLGPGSEEKLIRVSDGEELRFKKVKHGYYWFTWK